eukprot:68095_1
MSWVGVQSVTVKDTQNRNLTRSKQGYIEWKITGDLLQQVKNATQGQEFISPEFETIDGAKWQIILRPLKNGWMIQPGCILKCVTLSANKAKIGDNFLFNIMELDKSGVGAHIFTKHEETYTCLRIDNISKQIQNSSTLTIQCIAEETMDVRTSDTLFEWKITKHFLQKWKNAKTREYFWSPRLNAIGYEWYLVIYPNGMDTEGTAHLKIICNDLKKGDCVSVCYYTDTIGLDSDVCQIGFEKTIKKTEDENIYTIVCDPPFKLNDIQNQSEINISIKLWTESINNDQLRSITNHYLNQNKKISPKAWREYFVASPTHRQSIIERFATHLNSITAFLSHLGLEQHAAIFKENECKTMDDIQTVTNSHLMDMG